MMDVLRCTRICYRAGGRGCLPRDGGCPNVSISSWTPQFPCWPAHIESSADASRNLDLAEFALVMSLCLDLLEHLALVGAILIKWFTSCRWHIPCLWCSFPWRWWSWWYWWRPFVVLGADAYLAGVHSFQWTVLLICRMSCIWLEGDSRAFLVRLVAILVQQSGCCPL